MDTLIYRDATKTILLRMKWRFQIFISFVENIKDNYEQLPESSLKRLNKCRFYILANNCSCPEWGKLLYENNILPITSYFYEEVIYYSYILLYQKSNSIILLLLSKVIILCNLVTSYRVTLNVYL